jgi:hypothetical protein
MIRRRVIHLLAVASMTGCGTGDVPKPGAASGECGKFDRAAWKANLPKEEGRELSPRHRIADELIACKRLDGLKYSEVVALLGPPDSESSRRSMSYPIGQERGFISVDSEYLYLNLSSGRVTSAFVESG